MSKTIVVAALLLVVLLAYVECSISARISEPLNEDQFASLFKEFVNKYGRKYTSDKMKQVKYDIFKRNIENARQLNLQNPRATFGITKFSDMSPEEFKAKFTRKINIEKATSHLPRLDKFRAVGDVPENWDWRQQGAVTYVKDQGDCGSCWSFSVTGNIEGQWFLAGNKLTALSEQQILDCDHDCDSQGNCDAGCDGGLMGTAFNWIITKNNGSLATEDSYPYYAYTSKCQNGKSDVLVGAKGVTSFQLLPTNETQIRDYLYQNGPVSVGIDATTLQNYQWGILDGSGCSNEIDHGVLLVGYGWHDSKWFSPYGWWIVKNSWGSDFGEDGYFRLAYGHGACLVNQYASSATIPRK